MNDKQTLETVVDSSQDTLGLRERLSWATGIQRNENPFNSSFTSLEAVKSTYLLGNDPVEYPLYSRGSNKN